MKLQFVYVTIVLIWPILESRFHALHYSCGGTLNINSYQAGSVEQQANKVNTIGAETLLAAIS